MYKSIIQDDARIWLDRVWPKLHRPRPKLPRSGFPSWMCAYTIGWSCGGHDQKMSVRFLGFETSTYHTIHWMGKYKSWPQTQIVTGLFHLIEIVDLQLILPPTTSTLRKPNLCSNGFSALWAGRTALMQVHLEETWLDWVRGNHF